MKTTSLTTLVAAAGIFVGNSAYAPANAADLGGGCCADLEERVAELEATTARKGNRVVSLQIYGQVNTALLVWDDGIDSDAYVVTNNESNSRFGFIGSATMKPGWTAGYNIELGIVQDANSGEVNQLSDESASTSFDVRKNELYVESDRLGRVTLGKGSAAADGITEIVLATANADANPDFGNSFFVRSRGEDLVAPGVPENDEAGGVVLGDPELLLGDSTALTVSDFVGSLDGGRVDRVRYDTPSMYGFIVSTSWGENDNWDVALRFKKEWNSIRLAAGIAYQELSGPDADDEEIQTVSGSVSVMHVPTGIYAAFSAGNREFDEEGKPDADNWYVQAGIERRLLPYGATTIFGEYGQYNDFAAGSDAFTDGDGFGFGEVTSSEAALWGFGINQTFDSAALDIFAKVNFYSFDAQADLGGDPEDLNLEDQTFVMIGSRIKF